MKMKKIALLMLLLASTSFAADKKISELTLGTASGVAALDSFPYVDSGTSTTKRLKISELFSVPALSAALALKAPLASPSFTGTAAHVAGTFSSTLLVTDTATFTAKPIFSSLTASLPVIADSAKGLVSATQTGTGTQFMMSAGPTSTGTFTSAALTNTGKFGVISAPGSNDQMAINGLTTLTASTQRGFNIGMTATSAATVGITGLRIALTGAASTTHTDVIDYQANAPTLGAAGAMTRYIGFLEAGAAGHVATNNAALADGAAFTGNWFLNQAGTDASKLGGSLTVDTTTFFVDATNDAVGVGLTSPLYPLHVIGTTNGYGSGALATFRSTNHTAATRILVGNDVEDLTMSVDTSGNGRLFSASGKTMAIGSGGVDRLTFTSAGAATFASTLSVSTFAGFGTTANGVNPVTVAGGAATGTNSAQLRVASTTANATRISLAADDANVYLLTGGSSVNPKIVITTNDNVTEIASFTNTGLFTTAGGINGRASLLIGVTAPTISSGFGTSPSVPSNNGPGAFLVNVGTGGSASSGVIGLPSSAVGWNCFCADVSSSSSTIYMCRQTASSSNTATIANFNTAGANAAWAASDILKVSCFGY
jgi:hypothetical protein